MFLVAQKNCLCYPQPSLKKLLTFSPIPPDWNGVTEWALLASLLTQSFSSSAHNVSIGLRLCEFYSNTLTLLSWRQRWRYAWSQCPFGRFIWDQALMCFHPEGKDSCVVPPCLYLCTIVCSDERGRFRHVEVPSQWWSRLVESTILFLRSWLIYLDFPMISYEKKVALKCIHGYIAHWLDWLDFIRSF